MKHLSEEVLTRFINGEASRAENRKVVANMLKNCAKCSGVFKESWGSRVPEGEYDEALGKLLKSGKHFRKTPL